MTRTLLGMGAMGEIVKEVQRALIACGCDVHADGVYGQGTCDAVKKFQSENALALSGAVEEEIWQALMKRATPTVGERCLQLTAAFEGHGFELAMGDFDGAMLTWGIVGFTMKAGEVQSIVEEIHWAHPELVQQAFAGQAAELLQVMTASDAAVQKQWASAHTLKNGTLTEPWRTMFGNFGAMAEVQAEQIRRVRKDYLQPAVVTARKLGVKSELGLALCFDVHVQNGGIRAGAWKSIRQQLREGMAELEVRRLVANAVADSLGAKWREDVRSRKLVVATGEGTVHGHSYVLENWGLSGEIAAAELSEEASS